MSIDQSPEVRRTDSSALQKLVTKVESYVRQSISENTKKAYRSDWRHFDSWCHQNELESLPATPETVASYISALASGQNQANKSYAASTIQRRLTSLRVVHQTQNHEDPTDDERVEKVWQGIRRDNEVQTKQVGRKALLSSEIHQVVDAIDTDNLKGKRDRALVLIGFATGMRRSELVSVTVENLHFKDEGLVIDVPKSKTDQEGEGRQASVHYGDDYCPVYAVKNWLEEADIENGPVFRSIDRWGNVGDTALSGRSVTRMLKQRASDVGLEPARIGAHSLRAGHITQRKLAGESNESIMIQTGHSSKSTLRRYDRRAKVFRHDVTEPLGL